MVGSECLSSFILVLLICSALGNAIWNAISKQIEEKDNFFTLIIGVSVVLYFPLAIYLIYHHPIPLIALIGMLGSTVCELIYFYALARAYEQLSLSFAYPIIRGLSPLVATIVSFFLGIAITWLGFIGILIIVLGIFFMQESWKFRIEAGSRWAFIAGIINGFAVSIDSWGATLMSGVLFKYVVFIGIFLGKLVMNQKQVRGLHTYVQLFRAYPNKVIIGGVLTFGANAISQFALQTIPVGYVSATRELSIAFGVLIGLLFFQEQLKYKQLVGILSLLLGVILIKTGG